MGEAEASYGHLASHLRIPLAKAEAQLDALKEVLELELKRAEELRQERDRWASALEDRPFSDDH